MYNGFLTGAHKSSMTQSIQRDTIDGGHSSLISEEQAIQEQLSRA